MPSLTKVLTEEDFTSQPRGVNIDLTAYLAMIDQVTREGGVGGSVQLADDESQRTEKRRLSVAAKHQGYRLVWRKAEPGTLRFVLAADDAPVPGGRRRRTPAPPPAKKGRTRRA